MFATCKQCGQRSDVSARKPGTLFRCPQCKDGIVEVPARDGIAPPPVPSAPDEAEAREAQSQEECAAPLPPKRPPADRAGRRQPSSKVASRGARARAHAHDAAAPKGKSGAKVGLIVLGVVVVGGVLAYVMSGSGGDASSGKQPGGATSSSSPQSNATAANGKPAENAAGNGAATSPKGIDPAVARADYESKRKGLLPGDARSRVELAAFCDANELQPEARMLRREALVLDPDNAAARTALGFVKYDGKVSKLRGRWLDKVDQKRAETIEKDYDDSNVGTSATTADAFVRNCDEQKRRMIAEYPESDWLYAYGKGMMPQPFFVAIQRPKDEAKLERYRSEYATILQSLYETFFDRYEKRFKLERDIERPIRVIMFDSTQSYSAHIANHKDEGYADPAGIGGYYSPGEQRLIMWRPSERGTGLTIEQVLFHEGTHMFVHYAFSGKGFQPSHQTPWLQEGIAELFAGHKRIEGTGPDGAPKTTYVLNQFIPGRYGEYSFLEGAGLGVATLQLVKIDNYQFEEAKKKSNSGGEEGQKAQVLVSQIYAYGWVFCMYLNHAEGGKYREVLDDYIEAETKGEGYWQKLGELLGLKSEADWVALDAKVRKFASDELPKLK